MPTQTVARALAPLPRMDEERGPRGHLSDVRQKAAYEIPRIRPGCAARGPQRDEMAPATGAVQLLNVVPADQPALRVAHQIDLLAPSRASCSTCSASTRARSTTATRAGRRSSGRDDRLAPTTRTRAVRRRIG